MQNSPSFKTIGWGQITCLLIVAVALLGAGIAGFFFHAVNESYEATHREHEAMRKEIKFERGVLPTAPQNLGGANSSHDDFNVCGPPRMALEDAAALYFSSNRRSDHFDFEAAELRLRFDKRTGEATLEATMGPSHHVPPLPDPINTRFDELGPVAVSTTKGKVFLFASDRTGNLDVYLCTWRGEVTPAKGLNTTFDDAYPTLDFDRKLVYWCSNRAGRFDIYQARFETLHDLTQPLQVTRVAGLSSASDDKCPHVQGDRLLLVSNRPGGQGGFDVWTSHWDARATPPAWTTPRNLGPEVNTVADEYRPVIIPTSSDFAQDLMLFSSNRKNGYGGFDLYWRGTDVSDFYGPPSGAAR